MMQILYAWRPLGASDGHKEIMYTFDHEIINFDWHIKLEDFVIKCAHNFFHHASFTNI